MYKLNLKTKFITRNKKARFEGDNFFLPWITFINLFIYISHIIQSILEVFKIKITNNNHCYLYFLVSSVLNILSYLHKKKKKKRIIQTNRFYCYMI